MRINLIFPPRIQPKQWGEPCVYQPLELAYVAAVLEKKHNVEVIDAPTEGRKQISDFNKLNYRYGLTNEDINARLRSYSPDIVAISIPSSGWCTTTFTIAQITKNIDKNINVILFGMHPSVRPNECLMDKNIDYVIIGKPEYTIVELVDTIETGNVNPENIMGIGFIRNGKIIITPPRPLIRDLDALPFPAKHLLPMNEYFAAVKENPLRGEVNKRYANIITSRGCVNHCVFCSVHIMTGRSWRARSPKNVVDEIEHLIRTYHIKQIDFEDNNMALNKKRVEAICDLIIERKLNFEWSVPNGIRSDSLDTNLLEKMRKAGCKKIIIAPESGSQHVVGKIIKKNINLETVEQAVVLTRKAGIRVGCFLL